MALNWVEPFTAALALRDEPGLVLLESMPGFGHLGRRSVLAARPAELATDGLGALERTHGGWWAGWLSYDLGREIERLPVAAEDEFGLPSLALGRYEAHLEFDHLRRRIDVRGDGGADHLLRALDRASRVRLPDHRPLRWWDSSLRRPDYERAVRRAIDYIRAGDVFQVNLAQRLGTDWAGDPLALYGRLRRTSGAPFMALARLGGADVISASPERFLRRRGTAIETRPIKGTRPRGRSAAEDRALAAALRASTKDRAENVMIVDLLRNDLSRVCRPESVRVSQLCELETYEYVMHLVSAVCGRLRADCSPVDLLRASFPGGSITGAPKVRAMEIIAELEPVARGAYCGSLGYLGFDGSLDLNILIRTITAGRGWWQAPVGGGIVAQSVPEMEYDETWHKAEGLIRALT